MGKKNTVILIIIVAAISSLAGLFTLGLCIHLSWIPGILLLVSGVLWGIILWHCRIKGIGKFDRELSQGFGSQLSLLFSAVVIVFLFVSGLLLLFPHEFDKSLSPGNCYDVLLIFVYRYLNYNIYADGRLTSWTILILSILGTVLVGGLLITTLSNIVQQRKYDVESGLVKYNFTGHTVIIGFGDYSLHIVKNTLRSDSSAIVVLMTNHNVSRVRSRIRVDMTEDMMKRLFIISGEMISREDIEEKLCIRTAVRVYIMGEAGEFGVDSKCMECVSYVASARGENAVTLPVYAHFQHLYSNKYVKSAGAPSPVGVSGNIFFRPFCFYENWGRLLWSYFALPQYAPLDFEPVTPDKHVHLVVVGLDRMGAALVLQAARLCHYPGFKTNKTIISVIEKDSSIVDEFRSIYPGITKLEDIEVRFEMKEDGNYHTFESFADKLDFLARDANTLLTIAICYRDPDQALSAALRLPESVRYIKGLAGKDASSNKMRTRVLIRQSVDMGLGHMIDKDGVLYKNFQIFGMFKEGLDFALLDDSLPMLAKDNYDKMGDGSFVELYRTLVNGTGLKLKNYFEKLKPGWFNSREWARMSNRCQMDLCGSYLRALESEGLLHKQSDNPSDWDIDDYLNNGYYRLLDSDNRPDGAPSYDRELAERISEIEHRRWNAERIIGGWRAPEDGEGRMDTFYIHPDIVPFMKLSESKKINDIIVLRAIPLIHAIHLKMNGK